MKKFCLFIFQLLFQFTTLNAQDTLYHILCPNREEPLVSKWNVLKDDAIESKNYVMELKDSLGRIKALYFYYNGYNRRMRIDDPEIVLFKYNNNTVDIITEHSYETNYEFWVDEDFRCLLYHVVFDDNHRITDFSKYSFVDTLRKKDYYYEMKLEDDKEGLDSVLLEEYHGLKSCNDIIIPYIEFSFCKLWFIKKKRR